MLSSVCAVLPFATVAPAACCGVSPACAASSSLAGISLACSRQLAPQACGLLGKTRKKNVCFFGLKQRFGQGSNVAAVVPVADALSLSCLANLTDLSCSSLPFWADLTHVQCAFVAPRCFEAAPSLSVLSRSCCLAWTNKTLDALSLQRVSSLSSAGFSALNATMLVRLVQKHGTKIGKRKDNMIVVVVVVLNKTIFSGIFVCWSTFYS
jgi:hypothetical protein